MAKRRYPPPPPGYRIEFRRWRKDPRTGAILYASTYGLKAWPLLVPIE